MLPRTAEKLPKPSKIFVGVVTVTQDVYLYLSGYLRSKASRSSMSTQGCWSHGPYHDICSPAAPVTRK